VTKVLLLGLPCKWMASHPLSIGPTARPPSLRHPGLEPLRGAPVPDLAARGERRRRTTLTVPTPQKWANFRSFVRRKLLEGLLPRAARLERIQASAQDRLARPRRLTVVPPGAVGRIPLSPNWRSYRKHPQVRLCPTPQDRFGTPAAPPRRDGRTRSGNDILLKASSSSNYRICAEVCLLPGAQKLGALGK
jgi:hypothetical protein